MKRIAVVIISSVLFGCNGLERPSKFFEGDSVEVEYGFYSDCTGIVVKELHTTEQYEVDLICDGRAVGVRTFTRDFLGLKESALEKTYKK